METLQSWYYFAQEKCPVSDCTFCKNADHYLLKIDTHTSRALRREHSSSGYIVREVDHDARPICRDDCTYCNSIKEKYTNKKEENNADENNLDYSTKQTLTFLSPEIESFTEEVLPEVYRERNILVNKYKKIELMLCEIKEIKSHIKELESIKLCKNQEENLNKRINVIKKKYNAINKVIEEIYVQYKIAQQNNSLDIINDISVKSDEILQDLKSIHNEIPNL